MIIAMSVQRSLSEGGDDQTTHDDDDGGRHDFIRKHSDPNELIQNISRNAGPSNRSILVALDIDQCSCLGEDTNDILRILAAITANFSRSRVSLSDVKAVADQLINPALVSAIRKIKDRGFKPYIVFYTAKARIVNLFCDNTNLRNVMRRKGVLIDNDDTLVFKPVNVLANFDYLYDQIKDFQHVLLHAGGEIHRELRRLAILTWVASIHLELPYLASVYITRTLKDMHKIADHLRIPFQNTILFDDRAESHADRLGTSLAMAHMVPVVPFDTREMTRPHAAHLHETLSSRFPIPPDFAKTHGELVRDATVASRTWPEHRLALGDLPLGWNSRWALYARSEDEGQPWPLDNAVLTAGGRSAMSSDLRPTFRSLT